jgi:hypothetical protein
VTDDNLVAIVDYRNFSNLANSENETVQRIDHAGETGTGDESLEVGNKLRV